MEWSWWVLLLVPVAWLMENAVHECSHLLAAKIKVNATLKYMWLLPRWINKDTRENKRWWPWHLWRKPWPGKTRFVFARVVWDTQKKPPYPRVISFAPNYGALTVFLLALLVLILLPSPYRVFTLPWLVCPLVDAGNWWKGYFWGSKYSDGQRWRAGGRFS